MTVYLKTNKNTGTGDALAEKLLIQIKKIAKIARYSSKKSKQIWMFENFLLPLPIKIIKIWARASI